MRISDWSSDVCSSDLYGLPVTYLIDQDGLVVGYIVGAAEWDSPEALEFLRHYIRVRPAASSPGQGSGGLSGKAAVQGATRTLQGIAGRSEEHTSELQSLMRISYAVFCLNKKTKNVHEKHS